MEYSIETTTEDLTRYFQSNQKDLAELCNKTHDVLFGVTSIRKNGIEGLKDSYIAFNEIDITWELVPKKAIDREIHSLITEIQGIVTGDNQIYLVIRREVDLDIQPNRILAYLGDWPTNITHPEKEYRSIRL